MIGQMRPFNLSVQFRGFGLDIVMLDAQIFNMPVKFSLKFMSPVCPNGFDAKGKLSDHIINEGDSVGLGLVGVYLKARILVASSIAVY